jgi:hypothetical protein
MGTVTCPLLLMVLEGGIFTWSPRSKDTILYIARQSASSGIKGKELIHPIRIPLIGYHFG